MQVATGTSDVFHEEFAHRAKSGQRFLRYKMPVYDVIQRATQSGDAQ